MMPDRSPDVTLEILAAILEHLREQAMLTAADLHRWAAAATR